MAINWRTYSGLWSIRDRNNNEYSIGMYSSSEGDEFFEDIYKGKPLLFYIQKLEKNHPRIRWRSIVSLHRGGELKKRVFRNVWLRALTNADRDEIGYVLVSLFSGERHVGIKSQKDLDSYYYSKGFTSHPYKGTLIFVRFPKKLI